MTPPMYKRVSNLFIDAGLTEGFIVQYLLWTDDPNDRGKAKSYLVFRPGGGTNIDKDIGSDYFVMVDVISAKGQHAYKNADEAVNRMIDYIKDHPLDDKCVGQITNFGGIPSPILTEEGRLVFRLMFSCLYGE
ncbi:hypothetical protein QE177_04580 [Arsenophonus sp. aPb]|uniref:phage tail termination protein n=1 Tax=Arsenophonus sp. aPb TaxID=3041619 RepID=UPI00246885DE|nr:hypothetical protein [Arsenophonus sp. aPb]WGL99162.1 hypothetical protein QE177_04580 [Arsenophonus sp. aPb]